MTVFRVRFLVNLMIKTILFDFDGVILDSMKIKGDGFVELFKDYPIDAVQKLESYHYANGGISRFEKIRYFFNTILETPISNEKIDLFAHQFSEIIAQKLFDKKNLIMDTMQFIEKNYKKYHLYIVSGAEQNELRTLCNTFKIDHFFEAIYGSPTPKTLLVKNILEQNNILKNEVILIGDSINDYEAASKNGIVFFGYNNEFLRGKGNYISGLKDFTF